jgi:hypothetical protein
MAKVQFELKGDKELLAILKKFNYKDMQRAYKKALTASVKPLVNETKRSLRGSGIKNVGAAYIGANGRKYKSMIQGVSSSIDVRNADDNYAKVHILGEFRLKWFEKGTLTRKTYKKGYRGRIKPYRFFANAVKKRGDECKESLENNIKIAIQKIWERK